LDNALPQVIAHYRILRPLGAGGMGQVFLAEDTRLDRKVALKLLPAEVASDPVRRQRFLTEAKAASALNHPNVCVVHEVGEAADGRLFITMEFLDGETLDIRLRHGSLPTDEIAAIGEQVADALEAAQAKGIIHRDIKPSNISINTRGRVKVLDFGLAKRTLEGETRGNDLPTLAETQAGQVLGTPHYMSPEQAMGRAIDARSDIFSLGVVLYELATGRSPFAGHSLADTLDRILHARPEPISLFNSTINPELERILSKCLEKQADRRYQSARDLQVDLRNLQRDLGGLGAITPGTPLPATPAFAPPHSSPLIHEVHPAQDPRQSDVFISYASIDDQPVLHGRQGWVSQLHQNLEVRLEQLSGERVRVGGHSNAPGGGVDENIIKDLPSAKALVSVVSPPFVKSDGCRREVEAFWQTASRTGTLRVENKSRLFKVLKTPVDERELPPHLAGMFRQLLNHEFYEIDPTSGKLREFSEEFGEEARRIFLEKIYDLAYEINQVLKSCKTVEIAQALPGGPAASPKVVYLAETTSDLRQERDRIRREMQERGYEVAPEVPLPMETEELKPAIEAYLHRADTAVHLVGNRYGLVPEGSDESLVALQVHLSAKVFRNRTAGRFIWTPPGLQTEDPRQATFLRSLHEDTTGMECTELLSGSVEQLKNLVVKHLMAPPPVKQAPSPVAGEVKRVYLLCDRQDEQETEALADYLYDQGYEVKTPIFGGDDEAFAQIHQENLKLSDGVIVYFGKASAQWVEMKLLDLLKAPGYGRSKAWLAQAVYVAPPDDRRKERFRTRSAEVIKEASGFQPSLLAGFLRGMSGTNHPADPTSHSI